MKIYRKAIITFLLLFILSSLIHSLTIKIGSVAPARSPWDKALKELSREWSRITNGTVRLKIYSGGIVGNEEDMIRKMRVGLLGGAVLTNRGLTKLYPDVYVLNIPLLITSEEELNYLLDKMKPIFEKEIEKKGFKVIIWSMAGWVNFFTKHPVYVPDDMKRHKLSFTTGEPKFEQAWKKSGYHIVPNELKDLMMALQSGMVDAFYLPPLIAASGQYFPFAPNMLSLKIAPLIGGVVLTQKVWKRIPEEYKEEMLAVTRRMSKELLEKTEKLEKEAIDTMKENDLVVNKIAEGSLPQWKAASAKGMSALIGKAFSEEIYNIAIKHLNDYNKANDGDKNQ